MIPITKCTTTPAIRIGCIRNCTTGLYPIKWENSLKVSGEITEVKLMVKCKARNKTKKIPERAMTTFLAIEDCMSLLIIVQI
jgi:hypothetical protein